jgi:hypothetical protein
MRFERAIQCDKKEVWRLSSFCFSLKHTDAAATVGNSKFERNRKEGKLEASVSDHKTWDGWMDKWMSGRMDDLRYRQ